MTENKYVYRCVGTMSGTSLDGLDIVLCKFEYENAVWKYLIEGAVTIKYNKIWKKKLSNANNLNGLELTRLDNEFGRFSGEHVNIFIKAIKCQPDFIASHGHTVYHQPKNQLTLQIGNGAEIAAITGIKTVSNFRVLDVALGGQGAPLVPIGDKYLFGEYGFCLNLGGIANISYDLNGNRIAFDICPVNIIINDLVSSIGLSFDKDGKIASTGKTNGKLLKQLDSINYYSLNFPKSIGREWVESTFLPILNNYTINLEDKLHTVYEHIANQICKAMANYNKTSIIITGGGAYNKFLIKLINSKTKHKVIIPEASIIEYKEALIFAFLGLLRMRHENNCLASVTGASRNCSGGTIYLGM